jgi:PhzF family phenazine biosynthesis protein
MQIVPFKQVDVFTKVPYRGNPVAVVLDADELDSKDMQQLACWTNLSETTFVLKPTRPGADYRLRIFTPGGELPFAGHPSVGTAHALLECGFARQHNHLLVMECAAGVLPISIEGDDASRKLYVQAPPATVGEADMTLTMALAKALGLAVRSDPPPLPVIAGPNWLVVDLETEETVRGLRPNMDAIAELTRERDATGVAVYGRTGRNDYAMAVRCFGPASGIPEDPVTGSGNVCIAAYLREHGLVTPPVNYVSSQGREIGRDGYVFMRLHADNRIEVGGCAVTCIDGTIRL